MKKRILFASVLLLLLSTYNVQKSSNSNFEFNIKKIDIENNKFINDKIIKNKLSFLHETNLFFLNKKKIKLKLQEIDFIDSFEVKKMFPNKIKIKVYENIPIAIIQNKMEKKFYTNNGKVIDFIEIEEFSIQKDHIHLLCSIPPKLSISGFMCFLKGKTAIKIFQSYPKLKKSCTGVIIFGHEDTS